MPDDSQKPKKPHLPAALAAQLALVDIDDTHRRDLLLLSRLAANPFGISLLLSTLCCFHAIRSRLSSRSPLPEETPQERIVLAFCRQLESDDIDLVCDHMSHSISRLGATLLSTALGDILNTKAKEPWRADECDRDLADLQSAQDLADRILLRLIRTTHRVRQDSPELPHGDPACEALFNSPRDLDPLRSPPDDTPPPTRKENPQ